MVHTRELTNFFLPTDLWAKLDVETEAGNAELRTQAKVSGKVAQEMSRRTVALVALDLGLGILTAHRADRDRKSRLVLSPAEVQADQEAKARR